MSLPNANLIASSRKAAAQMATRDTSFIFNGGTSPPSPRRSAANCSRTLLGKRVVLYRTLSGQAVALEDRCAHRSFRYRAVAWEDGIVCSSRFPLRQPGRVDRGHRRRKPVRAASASVTTRFWSAARWSGFGSATRTGRPERLPQRPWLEDQAGPAPGPTSYTRATT